MPNVQTATNVPTADSETGPTLDEVD